MKVRVLSSGSKGNCTIIKSDKIILIDIGITYQNLLNLLEKINISINEIDYVLITHTHSDHIKGLKTLVNKTNIKVYILESMLEEIKNIVPVNRINYYSDPFEIGNLKISTIKISHDVDGVGFIINEKDKSLVYITDTGYISEKNLEKLKNKSIYILESNHDEKMLMDGPYPYILKQRVLSDKGHLSNTTTANYLLKIVGNNTKKIILAHLSETNNTEELAIDTTKQLLLENNIKIDIEAAKQHEIMNEVEV